MVIFEHYLVSNLIERFVEDFCSFYFEILLICLDVPLFLFFQNQCLLVKTLHLYFLAIVFAQLDEDYYLQVLLLCTYEKIIMDYFIIG